MIKTYNHTTTRSKIVCSGSCICKITYNTFKLIFNPLVLSSACSFVYKEYFQSSAFFSHRKVGFVKLYASIKKNNTSLLLSSSSYLPICFGWSKTIVMRGQDTIINKFIEHPIRYTYIQEYSKV